MTCDAAQGNCAKEIKLQKNLFRDQYKQKRAELPPQEKKRRESEITRIFLNSASFRYYNIFLLYAALEHEIDLSEIARAALAAGKKIAFPLCSKDSRDMTYRYVDSLSLLAPGAYGIPEPPAHCPVFHKSESRAVCIVPGIVFDKRGYRIGYGKGYYDRYLSDFRGMTVGVIYSDFIVPALPNGKFDLHTDVLLCEKGVRTVAEN